MGVDSLYKQSKEFINKEDAFRVDLYLREVKAIEYDSDNSASTKKD